MPRKPEYISAAKNAIFANFDGIEHAANDIYCEQILINHK
jgi:2,4-dienoyl-CoA reductase-like NADH-dependent reductase (Old Yellow Enzyme family)